jgi:hypothetical protein
MSINYDIPQSVSDDEKKWRAESDARTLAETEVIMGDKDRLSAAREAAKKMADKAQEEARGMANVAKSLKYEKV